MFMEKDEQTTIRKEKSPTKNGKNISKWLKKTAREIVAVLFWAYIIIKVFIFDFDVLILNKLLPNYAWLLDYKFFILLGILAIIFLISKNKQIITWSLFILFYPFIVLFWKIPSFLFKNKNWNYVFALVDSIVSFFESPKLPFIKAAFFLITALIIFLSKNTIILWISICITTMILFWEYVQKTTSIFKPPSTYKLYTKFIRSYGNFIQTNPAVAPSEIIKTSSDDTPEKIEEQKKATHIQQIVLFNRVCIFLAKKIKAYQESKFNVLSYVFGILIIILFTIFSFALINYGLFKINPSNYSYTISPNFFNFFFYSFNGLLSNSIPELVAIKPASQVLFMMELSADVFLLVIFVGLVFNIKDQKMVRQIDDLIADLSNEGEEMESYLKSKYQYNSISDAMEALKKLNMALTDLLYKITESID